jgi:hypothetical protein
MACIRFALRRFVSAFPLRGRPLPHRARCGFEIFRGSPGQLLPRQLRLAMIAITPASMLAASLPSPLDLRQTPAKNGPLPLIVTSACTNGHALPSPAIPIFIGAPRRQWYPERCGYDDETHEAHGPAKAAACGIRGHGQEARELR